MSYNLKHLSLLTTLLFSSSMVYAGWISTGMDYRGDCLEMMCDCVEDSETRDGYCCPNGTAFANTGNPHPTYTPCKCPEDQEWDDATSKCIEIKCPEGWYKDKGLCCPYGQVNYQGVCTCENPVNKCGNACCNGVGEKCMDPENSICCATQLCGGECCATDAQCIENKCVNPCPEGEKLVDYYDKSGVKKQTCCAENLHGADWDGNCCPAGLVGAFGHNHSWQYISRCCPKEGQEDKGMVGLRGLAETYSCAPPDTTMDASAEAGKGGTGHTWYVPRGSKNVRGDGWACAPESKRGGTLHLTCGNGVVCRHGWKKGRDCSYCYGEWDENNICRLPNCTKPREHIAYCYCNPENGSVLEYNYYTGGEWSPRTPNDVCVTPKNKRKKSCTKGMSFYNETYGCMSCETYLDGKYGAQIKDKENCLNCPMAIWNGQKCSQCPANSKPNADNSECICKEGYYKTSAGTCNSCSDAWYATTTEEACYQCPENTRMWSKYNGYNYCFDCNYSKGFYAWFTKAECDRCPNRYFKDGKCSLCPANTKPNSDGTECVCKEGYYKTSDGTCNSCSDAWYATTTKEACYQCPENTRMWSKYNGYNYCFDCNYSDGFHAWFTKAECDRCPNRYFKDGNCSLCPKGQMATADGTACE